MNRLWRVAAVRSTSATATVAASSTPTAALLTRLLGAALPVGSASPAGAWHLPRASLHTSSRASAAMGGFAADDDADGSSDDDGAGAGGGRSARERRGRPFLDPRAPRRQESIRSDPVHSEWGGLIDILEHNAYCDGQREEDPDGFFFDQTRPEYDSDCDGDPFSNGYLTEDELEFNDEYQVQPYIPARVYDQIYFLYSVRGYSIKQLCSKYRLGSERVSAIIHLKQTEPEMVATGRFTTKLDAAMCDLYGTNVHFAAKPKLPGADNTAAANASETAENWKPDFDQGVGYNLLQDDQMPDDVMPIRRTVGNVLRVGHHLPRIPPPAKAARLHDSKFVFRDISGKRAAKPSRGGLIVSDYDGSIRMPTPTEVTYRSWQPRHTDLEGPGARAAPTRAPTAPAVAKSAQ